MEGGRVFLRHLSEVATVLGNMMTNEEDLLLKMKRSPAPRPKATVHDQRPTKAIADRGGETQPQQAIDFSWTTKKQTSGESEGGRPLSTVH